MLNICLMFTYDERQELVFTLILASAGSWYLQIGLQLKYTYQSCCQIYISQPKQNDIVKSIFHKEFLVLLYSFACIEALVHPSHKFSNDFIKSYFFFLIFSFQKMSNISSEYMNNNTKQCKPIEIFFVSILCFTTEIE